MSAVLGHNETFAHSALLADALTAARGRISGFLRLTDWSDRLRLAFGEGVDLDAAESWLRQFAAGSALLPRLDIRSAAELQGANGAYAASNDTIYVNSEFLAAHAGDTETVAAMLLEELGHALDARFNATDTPGDEGAVFASLASGQTLTPAAVDFLASEQDQATLHIDGQLLQVEQETWNLGLLQGNVTHADLIAYETDYWNFQIIIPGGPEDYIKVDTDGAVDLVIDLYDSNLNFKLRADSHSLYSSETLSLNGLPAGFYSAVVYDYEHGAYLRDFWGNYYPAPYSFEIEAPRIPEDEHESNDTLDTATPVTDGQQLPFGLRYFSDLSIDQGGLVNPDIDTFRFTTSRIGTDADYILAAVDPRYGGDIDLALRDAAGNLVASTYFTATGYGWNGLSLAGLLPGTYYLRAGSYEGNITPSYELLFSVPLAAAPDRFENNNTFQTARNLGSISGFRSEGDLSIHTSLDQDWFKFQLTGLADWRHYLRLDLDSSRGDLDVILYDANGRAVLYSAGSGDAELIPLAGLGAGTYYAQVYGFWGDTGDYRLSLNAPGATGSLVADPFEANNSRGNATDLADPRYGWARGSGFYGWQQYLSITAGDSDWFKLELKGEADEGHFAAIQFDTRAGDLDLYLYRQDGTTLVRSAAGLRDLEVVDLDGLAAGTYYLKVVGYNNATQPNYSLFVNTPGTDRYEENDDKDHAHALTRNQAVQTWDHLTLDDADWFEFHLGAAGTARDSVWIDFNHAAGDLDLRLYGSGGDEPLRASLGVGNRETISLDGLAEGDYRIEVFGYDGATNADYALTIAAPVGAAADWAESPTANDQRATATNLNALLPAGQTQLQIGYDAQRPLSIHEASDVDWFKLTLTAEGRPGDHAALALDHTLGDLDIELYDALGRRLDVAEGVANIHQIDLKGRAAGEYYLKVYGFDGATNPSYALSVQAPLVSVAGDWSEANNSAAQAKNLGVLSDAFSRGLLSIHTAQDTDWFKFQIAGKGGSEDRVGIRFDPALGDLDLRLYAADGITELGSSTGIGGVEAISLNGRDPNVDYYLKVYGYGGATHPDYTLFVDAPADPDGDWAEGASGAGNNTAATAFNLRAVEGLQSWDTFSVHKPSDVDWYQFTTLRTADATDFVRIEFDHTLGDLDLYLYDATGTRLLGKSETTNGFEEVALTDAQGTSLAAGTYKLKVGGYEGATNPGYRLYVQAPDGGRPDVFEPNDETRTDLQTVEGVQTYAGLSLHQSGDEDWFMFETTGTAGDGHSVSIHFDQAEGDLQLSVHRWDSAASVWRILPNGVSESDSNTERVSLAGLPAGDYGLRVWGKTPDVANPSYTLVIDAPEPAKSDFAEGNDTRATAYDLREVHGVLRLGDLSVHAANDIDWFRFELGEAGRAGDVLRIDFDRSEGDLRLELYDGAGTLLTNSATVSNFEEISLAGRGAGTYYARVAGESGATNPEYGLTVVGAPELAPDQAEVNDTPGAAYDLRDLEPDARSASRVFESVLGGQSVIGFTAQNMGSLASISGSQVGAGQLIAPLIQSNTLPPFTQNTINSVLGDLAYTLNNSGSNVDQFLLNAALPGLTGALNVSGYNPYLNVGGHVLTGGNFVGAFNPRPTVLNTSQPMFFGGFESGIGNQYYTNWGNTLTSSGLGGILDQNAGFYNPSLNFGTNFLQNATGLPYPQALQSTLSGIPGIDSVFTNVALAGIDLNAILGIKSTGQDIISLPALSVHAAGDQDWFRFTLSAEGAEGQFALIRFDHDRGDLQLELFEAFDTGANTTEGAYRTFLVDTANGKGDLEQISLAGLAAGAYFLRVSGVGGATNPEYSLQVTAPLQGEEGGDWAEPNDGGSAAYDLRTVDGPRVLTELSIDAGDQDFFKFTTLYAGRDGDVVRIDFSHAQGDLDLYLYDAAGTTVLRQSDSTDDVEEISLAGLAKGEYQIKVAGYEGATNPHYTLTVSAPATIGPDNLEPNNAATSAVDLDRAEGVGSLAATIHGGDVDWFKFTTQAVGVADNAINLNFDHGRGDLRLDLYDKDSLNTPLRSAQGAGDTETISLADLPAETYYVKVSGAGAGVTNEYRLQLDAPSPGAANPADSLNEWTVMVYMTGSDLDQFAFKDINEMEAASALLPEGANFAVLWDQSSRGNTFATAGETPWGDVGRGIIRPDFDAATVGTDFERIGEKNTGAGQTLVDFVEWAAEAAPAERYALVMWDHGGGFLGGFNLDNEGALGAAADVMYTDELAAALTALQASDIDLDLLAFDACLMAQAEVGYALKDLVPIIVASEETEGADGYDYTTAFSTLFGDPGLVDAAAQASNIVTSYQTQYLGEQRAQDTQSALDSDGFATLATRLAAFTSEALKVSTTQAAWNAMRDAYDAATPYYEATYRDLGQFLANVVGSTAAGPTTALKNAASAAAQALDDLVIAKTADQRDSSGLSIYFPGSGSPVPFYSDGNESFLDATGWDDFLQAFLNRTANRAGSSPGDWAESSDLAARAQNLHTLVADGHTLGDLSLHATSDVDWFRFETTGTGTVSDDITARYASATGRKLTLTLYAVDGDRETPLRTSASGVGVETLSLRGLPAKEYLLQVRNTGSSPIADYSLAIDAPGTVADGLDWARGNSRNDKALDLGTVAAQDWLSGLQVDAGHPDWFDFATPKSQIVEPGTVYVNVRGSQPVVAELYRHDAPGRDVLLNSQTGTGQLQLNYPGVPGQDFRIKISVPAGGAAAGYTLNFALYETAITGGTLRDILTGGSRADTLQGLAGNDDLDGKDGNDVLNGGPGSDSLRGGSGDDRYYVDSARDRVIEAGADSDIDTVYSTLSHVLAPALERLVLTGNAAIDGTGNTKANVLTGNTAANKLDGRAGADVLQGGPGDDVYVVDAAGDRVVEGANRGTDTVQSAIPYVLPANVENLVLTGARAIDGTGNAAVNVLTGNAAANKLDGRAGADVMQGGPGNDVYLVDQTDDRIVEGVNAGTDTVQSSVSYVLPANVENLILTGSAAINGTGNTLDNVLAGNSGDNVLSGGRGVDTVSYALASAGIAVDLALTAAQATGGAGNDRLLGFENVDGSRFDDRLTGNGVANVIQGGAGRDILNGKAGNDILTGGAGNDRFVFDGLLSPTTNVDHVTDFLRGRDGLQLDDAVFRAFAGRPLTAGNIAQGAAAADADDFILYDATTGSLFYDPDGNGAAAALPFAVIDNRPALAASDFFVV